MRKYFSIYEEAVSHIWICNCSILNFLIYDEYLIFCFISVEGITHVHNYELYRHQSKMSASKKIDLKKGHCSMCLSEFIDWRYSQSCWYFRPSFVNCCPSNLLSGLTLPSPFPVWISILVCVWGGGYGVLGLRQTNTCRKVSLQVNLFRWRYFALPSISLIFLQHHPFCQDCRL